MLQGHINERVLILTSIVHEISKHFNLENVSPKFKSKLLKKLQQIKMFTYQQYTTFLPSASNWPCGGTFFGKTMTTTPYLPQTAILSPKLLMSMPSTLNLGWSHGNKTF